MDADFVIVGAGAAGGVMAARLSEDRAKHVLLIEVGTDYQRAGNNQGLPDAIRYGYGNPGSGGPAEVRGHHWYPDSDNPLAATTTIAMPGGLYGYTGEADELHAVDLPRGRVIGGTTAVNSQRWVRATTEDFDYWSGALGCKTWSFANVLPFLNVVDTDADYGTEAYHGDHGPITVRRHPRSAWREADLAWPRSLCRRGVCELRGCQRTRDLGWHRCSGAQQRHPRAPELSAHLPRPGSRAPEPGHSRRLRGPTRGL